MGVGIRVRGSWRWIVMVRVGVIGRMMRRMVMGWGIRMRRRRVVRGRIRVGLGVVGWRGVKGWRVER